MTAAAIISGFVLVLSVLVYYSWRPEWYGDRLNGWYHKQARRGSNRWSVNAWKDACNLSLERSRLRRGKEA